MTAATRDVTAGEDRTMTFTANNELALHVADPAAAEAFYTRVLGSVVFDRSPDCIALTNGALRLYLLRDPARRHDAVIPSFDVPDRAAALALLPSAGCSFVPIGPHAPNGFYVQDPFGVVFDVVERGGGRGLRRGRRDDLQEARRARRGTAFGWGQPLCEQRLTDQPRKEIGQAGRGHLTHLPQGFFWRLAAMFAPYPPRAPAVALRALRGSCR